MAQRALRTTVTISLPPKLAQQMDRVARRQGRTRSELLREAFRQYMERLQRWEDIFAWGHELGRRSDLTEEDLATAIRDERRKRRRWARAAS